MKLPPKKAKEPYVSMNKLAEYMEAKPIRRTQIISQLKADRDYYKVFYSNVRNILPNYVKNNFSNINLENAIKRIKAKKSTSTWDEKDHPNSILALESLKDMIVPNVEDYDVVNLNEKVDHIMLSGVKVIIKPDVYLKHKKTKQIGGVKFHIAKTKSSWLSANCLEYASTIIKCGFMHYGYDEKDVDNKACISLDVFQKTFGTSPKSYKRSMNELESACKEIADRWSTL